jgi:formylglycine-generating enzyme required for sulfatase activity
MAGNVWRDSDCTVLTIIRSWWRPGVARNPQGLDSSYDPSEPDQPKRVHRGGSYLCTDEYCSRYIVGTRGKGEVDTGTNHLGFRCVKPGDARTVQAMAR